MAPLEICFLLKPEKKLDKELFVIREEIKILKPGSDVYPSLNIYTHVNFICSGCYVTITLLPLYPSI